MKIVRRETCLMPAIENGQVGSSRKDCRRGESILAVCDNGFKFENGELTKKLECCSSYSYRELTCGK